jgi:hypothetical protein
LTFGHRNRRFGWKRRKESRRGRVRRKYLGIGFGRAFGNALGSVLENSTAGLRLLRLRLVVEERVYELG